jgi:hypothetical protein
MRAVALTCRIADDPHQAFTPEPLPAEALERHTLRRLRLEWSDQPADEAARMGIAPLLARLERGKVLGQTFLPVAEDGSTALNAYVFNARNPAKVLGDESPGTLRILGPERLLASFEGVDDYAEGVLIGNNENFGHWLLNHLARLALVSTVPALATVPVVVGDNATERQLECLQLAGVDRARVIRLRRGRLAQFKVLWAPTMPFFTVNGLLFWSSAIVGFLRRRLGAGAHAAPSAGRRRRRLYLSRRNSRWRRLLNESAVLQAVAAWGFEVVDPGELTMAQQLALAADAEVVAGPFGAGMNLLLFAPENACIIELKPYAKLPMSINPALSGEIGQRYVEIVGTPSAVAGTPPLNQDFSVAPESVVQALEALGIPR